MNESNLGSRLTNYWKQVGETVGRLYDTLTLRSACHEIADYHTSRANSFSNIAFRLGEKMDLTDMSGSGKDLIRIEDAEGREFAVDEYGIYIGVIEGNVYHKLESDKYVEIAKKYRGLEKSLLKRIVYSPKIFLYRRIGFPIKKFFEIGTITFVGALSSALKKGVKQDGKEEHRDNVPELEQTIQKSLVGENEENRE